MTRKTSSLRPSDRGVANLKPSLMIDLQREQEKYPVYDPIHCPDGLIDISSAENRLMHDKIGAWTQHASTALLHDLSDWDSDTAGSMELREAIAAYTNMYFGPSELVSAESIIVGNGVSSLLGTLAFNVCDLSEALMIETPNYGMFEVDLTYQNGIQLVYVDTAHIQDPFSAPCADELIEAYESSISDARARGVSVKAVVLCNPCNPSGRCYSRTSIAAIRRFCSKHCLHLVVDEIYALSSGGNTAELDGFTSVLAVSEEVADEDMSRNVHILSGISKDFGLGGLRIGWLITRNDLVWKAVRRLAVTTWVTGFSDKFAIRLLSDLDFIADYSNLYKKRLEARRDHAMACLRSIGVPFSKNNAGLFLWIDLSRWLTSFRQADAEVSFKTAVQLNTSPTLEMSKYLMKRGIFLQPDDAFLLDGRGKYRLTFTGHPIQQFDLAISRLQTALGDIAL